MNRNSIVGTNHDCGLPPVPAIKKTPLVFLAAIACRPFCRLLVLCHFNSCNIITNHTYPSFFALLNSPSICPGFVLYQSATVEPKQESSSTDQVKLSRSDDLEQPLPVLLHHVPPHKTRVSFTSKENCTVSVLRLC